MICPPLNPVPALSPNVSQSGKGLRQLARRSPRSSPKRGAQAYKITHRIFLLHERLGLSNFGNVFCGGCRSVGRHSSECA